MYLGLLLQLLIDIQNKRKMQTCNNKRKASKTTPVSSNQPRQKRARTANSAANSQVMAPPQSFRMARNIMIPTRTFAAESHLPENLNNQDETLSRQQIGRQYGTMTMARSSPPESHPANQSFQAELDPANQLPEQAVNSELRGPDSAERMVTNMTEEEYQAMSDLLATVSGDVELSEP